MEVSSVGCFCGGLVAMEFALWHDNLLLSQVSTMQMS